MSFANRGCIFGAGGGLGSGKTTILSLIGYDELKQGNVDKVFANYNISFGERINPSELVKFDNRLDNSMILLTEAYTFDDARKNGIYSRLLSYFVFQTRKRNIKIGYDAQLIGSVDLRLRYISDFFILCENHNEYLKYTFYKGLNPVGSYRMYYADAKKFLDMKLFDTDEIISPLEIDTEAIDFEKIIELFGVAPTKKTFISLVQNDYKFLLVRDIEAVYDLMKDNQAERARSLIRA
jgi:hypothetical protein